MFCEVSPYSNDESGWARWKTAVYLLGVLTLVTDARYEAAAAPVLGLTMYCIVALTSADVNGEPSSKGTAGRRSNVTVLPPSPTFQLVASCGSTCSEPFSVTSCW